MTDPSIHLSPSLLDRLAAMLGPDESIDDWVVGAVELRLDLEDGRGLRGSALAVLLSELGEEAGRPDAPGERREQHRSWLELVRRITLDERRQMEKKRTGMAGSAHRNLGARADQGAQNEYEQTFDERATIPPWPPTLGSRFADALSRCSPPAPRPALRGRKRSSSSRSSSGCGPSSPPRRAGVTIRGREGSTVSGEEQAAQREGCVVTNQVKARV